MADSDGASGLPNIVVEGRGRFLTQCFLNYAAKQTDMMSTRNPLDSNKSGVKVCMIPTENGQSGGSEPSEPSEPSPNEVDVEVLVFNDEDSDMDCYLNAVPILADDVEVVVIDTVTEEEIEVDNEENTYEFTVPAFGVYKFIVRFSVGAEALSCTLSSLMLWARNKLGGEEGTECDMVCAAVLTQTCTVDDVSLQYEMMLKDKALFPASASYTFDEVVNDFIYKSTEMASAYVRPNWRTSIACTQLVKQYTILRVMYMLLYRLCVNSATAATVWQPTLAMLKEECTALEQRILTTN